MMQGSDSIMTNNTPQRELSPYLESPASSRVSSPVPSANEDAKCLSDDENDEISVGCPSPALNSPKNYSVTRESSPSYVPSTEDCRCISEPPEMDDYFKPLKRLKMVHIESEKRLSPTAEVEERTDGVKSFSIMDILNHRPSAKTSTNARIVRPWDLDPDAEAQQNFERFQRHLKAQQMALLRPDFAGFNTSYTSETGSDRSSSVTSDCCSPDIVVTNATGVRRLPTGQGKSPGSTPLDALFQMTSKTFDSNTGESSTGMFFFKYYVNILSPN